MKYQYPQTVKGNLIDGQFAPPVDPNGEIVSRCPGDHADELGRFRYSYADIDRAVLAAREAFRTWREVKVEQRALLLKKYQDALKKRQEELVEVIAREVGKPKWECKAEVATMINKVDVTLNDSLRLIAPVEIPNIMDGVKGGYHYRPHGVMAVLGPFNFPGHLPTGHIIPALLTGNTVVFKPSEKAPLVGQLVAECFAEAGFPDGVLNLIQGEKEVGRRLVVHEGISGVLFTGSNEVGLRIKQDTLTQHWKILALEMGGKNPAIVWEDADLDVALAEILFGGYVTAGQRCSATSRVIIHRSKAEEFVSRFHERAKAFTIGHPLDDPFMGPVIDSSVVDRYLKFMTIAGREGFELVMRGKALKLDHPGNYVAPSICWARDVTVESTRKSVYQQTELFAPNISVVEATEPEEAVALANATQYGLVASIFTRSKATYEKMAPEIEAGLINWNKATVGASSKLPFGGIRKSGNHVPAALFSTYYCTYPVASLETENPKVNPSQIPGLNWK